MHRYALRDDRWAKIKDFLPGPEGHVGGTAADKRLFVDAVIIAIGRAFPGGICRSDTGPTHKRYRGWCESGVFARIFEMLASDCDNEYMMLDATIVCAHQHSAGAQKTARTRRSADHAAG